MIRILPALLVLVLAIVLTWTLARRSVESVPPQPPPTVSLLPTAAAADPPAAAAPTDPAYRLAGTVVGDRLYAIIEAPGGGNELYGIDADVPGIGKLIAVGPNWATFESDGSRFDMRLAAAPTPTPRATPDSDADEQAAEVGERAEDDYDDEYDDEYIDDEDTDLIDDR
jgi:hypothetical protein